MPSARPLIITIDGPSGSGKSTAAKNLAKRLGYLYLDTGAMYRAIALKALRLNIPLSSPKALTQLAHRSRISFRVDPGHQVRVLLDGSDVTEAIRSHAVSEAASRVAVISGVRQALVRQQRAIGSKGRVVAEGRDTGTVIFPKAPYKFFLTATLLERARRRYRDLKRSGESVPFADVRKDLRSRDQRDRSRRISPLRPAPGAIRVDNTTLQSSQVADILINYVRGRSKRRDRGSR